MRALRAANDDTRDTVGKQCRNREELAPDGINLSEEGEECSLLSGIPPLSQAKAASLT
jgi:hypothetical protein